MGYADAALPDLPCRTARLLINACGARDPVTVSVIACLSVDLKLSYGERKLLHNVRSAVVLR